MEFERDNRRDRPSPALAHERDAPTYPHDRPDAGQAVELSLLDRSRLMTLLSRLTYSETKRLMPSETEAAMVLKATDKLIAGLRSLR